MVLRLLFAIEPENDFGGAANRMVQQALINVTNLFDVERSKAQTTVLPAAPGNLHFEELKSLKQVENGAVVNWKRLSASCLPVSIQLPALKEREPIGVEELAPVSRQCSKIMIDSAVNCTEGSQQARKSVIAALQDFLAEPISGLAKLVVKGRNSVIVVINQVRNRE